MKKIYCITGANGHLGSALCKALSATDVQIRAFVLPNEDTSFIRSLGAEIFVGDVRNLAQLDKMFEGTENACVYAIHAAGIVDIVSMRSELAEDVNINGTKNMLDCCKRHNVERMLYVSSVHAIPEQPKFRITREIDAFDPERVVGAYAKTKATATQMVLDAVRFDGLQAVVVHPSGIIGPYSGHGNHLVQLVQNYMDGKLPAYVSGGYDFVDVRDCADGCLRALQHGRIGECYILSNTFCTIGDLLAMLKQITHGRRVFKVSHQVAGSCAEASARRAMRRGRKPLFTKYSLYTLLVNADFSHEKATAELGYRTRDLYETLSDTAAWLKTHRVPCDKKSKATTRTAKRVKVKTN